MKLGADNNERGGIIYTKYNCAIVLLFKKEKKSVESGETLLYYLCCISTPNAMHFLPQRKCRVIHISVLFHKMKKNDAVTNDLPVEVQ